MLRRESTVRKSLARQEIERVAAALVLDLPSLGEDRQCEQDVVMPVARIVQLDKRRVDHAAVSEPSVSLWRRKYSPASAAATAESVAERVRACSCSARSGISDSVNEEQRPLALRSQFHPPSGHCRLRNRSASASARSSASPNLSMAHNALPSIEACNLGSPWTLPRVRR